VAMIARLRRPTRRTVRLLGPTGRPPTSWTGAPRGGASPVAIRTRELETFASNLVAASKLCGAHPHAKRPA
jgi:hypothetical protein